MDRTLNLCYNSINTDLVKRIAQSIIATVPAGVVDVDDLMQVGMLGFLDAEANPDVPFAAYAAIRIRGAKVDELREMDCLSRDNRQAYRTISAAEQRLEQQLVRRPRESEMCVELGMSRRIHLLPTQSQTQVPRCFLISTSLL